MQLRDCPAPLSNDVATPCDLPVSPPHPFDGVHSDRHRALEEEERAAAREGDVLKAMVDKTVAADTDTYTAVQKVQTARVLVELYVRALERQIEAATALRVCFGHDDATEILANLETSRKGAAALIQRLADREDVLVAEDKARSAAAELRSILSVPHEPFSCDEGSASGSASEGQCPTIKRTSQRCTLASDAGQRFCMLHTMTHTSVAVLVQKPWDTMEASRKKVEHLIEVGKRISWANNSGVVKDYIRRVNEAAEAAQKHQAMYSCKPAADYEVLVEDLGKRVIAAMLVLGELVGGEDFEMALRRGDAEAWAHEHLENTIKQEESVGGDVVAGAMVGAGLSAMFGGPVGIGAFVGGAAMWARHASGKDKSV